MMAKLGFALNAHFAFSLGVPASCWRGHQRVSVPRLLPITNPTVTPKGEVHAKTNCSGSRICHSRIVIPVQQVTQAQCFMINMQVKHLRQNLVARWPASFSK